MKNLRGAVHANALKDGRSDTRYFFNLGTVLTLIGIFLFFPAIFTLLTSSGAAFLFTLFMSTVFILTGGILMILSKKLDTSAHYRRYRNVR